MPFSLNLNLEKKNENLNGKLYLVCCGLQIVDFVVGLQDMGERWPGKWAGDGQENGRR